VTHTHPKFRQAVQFRQLWKPGWEDTEIHLDSVDDIRTSRTGVARRKRGHVEFGAHDGPTACSREVCTHVECGHERVRIDCDQDQARAPNGVRWSTYFVRKRETRGGSTPGWGTRRSATPISDKHDDGQLRKTYKDERDEGAHSVDVG
jgi:hypothetical protein